MKQHALTHALGLGLATMLAAGGAQADDAGEQRVWVKFKSDARTQMQSLAQARGGRIHHQFDALNAMAVSLPADAVQALRDDPRVEFVEEDPIRVPMAQTVPFGIEMVQALEAVAMGADGSGVLVCVIDSGLYTGHEDIEGIANITGGNAGWDTDTCGHGTHVAGTIAAVDNDVGVIGVSPGKVDLHIVRVFSGGADGCGWTFSSGLIAAANNCAAAANGRKVVINMSLGGPSFSSTENNGFQALFDQGVLSVAAAGNGGNTAFSYPASYDSVISVAAIDSNKALASFSQRNNQVELAAPGVGVLSTVPWSGASLDVAGQSFQVAVLEGSFQGTASGELVDGGRCTSVGSWSGKVVLCERGDISFGQKVSNATQGGAVAAVVYNNVPGGFSGTLGGSSSIPALSASQEDGQFLVANRLGVVAEVSSVFTQPGSGYEAWNGTSMASPHVAGVAALLWSAHPDKSNQEIRDVMAATAEDLGAPGYDTSFGWGLVQAKAALEALTPPVVAPSELTATVILSGRQVKGVQLDWKPGSASEVDIFRNGARVASAANTGSFTIASQPSTSPISPIQPSGSVYKVCVKDDDSQCSNEARARY